MRIKIIRFFIYFAFTIISISCSIDEKGFEFNNFKNTPAWNLAKAVRENDVEKIREILKDKSINIDYQEPKWKLTLLTLSIVNEKREAFLELLRLGANPNLISGKYHDSSSLTEAIIYQKANNLFYIEVLLKHGANPNLIIRNDGRLSDNYLPIITAIDKGASGDDNTNILDLLIKYGANINNCVPKFKNKKVCLGVINECITMSCINYLNYFVIEKKISIPKTAFIYHYVEDTNQEVFTLTEILNTKEYEFEDFEDELGKHDLSKERKLRNEILEYLKKTGQE